MEAEGTWRGDGCPLHCWKRIDVAASHSEHTIAIALLILQQILVAHSAARNTRTTASSVSLQRHSDDTTRDV